MEERAQKIVQICIDKCEPYRTEAIAAALEQACAEARAEEREFMSKAYIEMHEKVSAKAFLDGQAVMRERAAKQIDKWICSCGDECLEKAQDAIRSLPLEAK